MQRILKVLIIDSIMSILPLSAFILFEYLHVYMKLLVFGTFRNMCKSVSKIVTINILCFDSCWCFALFAVAEGCLLLHIG